MDKSDPLGLRDLDRGDYAQPRLQLSPLSDIEKRQGVYLAVIAWLKWKKGKLMDAVAKTQDFDDPLKDAVKTEGLRKQILLIGELIDKMER